ncbi:AAA family ATPase [Vibrio jasicida]|uniref:AAA family ATPase n=1 Tax=Vibrio jasicida TaxID=766224 RepID=UPI00039B8A0C|nr:AAA family ATPase [Vibrio jasicida]
MSDKPLYLQKLRLSGFRAYTRSEEITFPDGPGLTVIVGPNGLGKSTLFDGVEWALTGELKKIESIKANSTEKGLSIGANPEVELCFSDDSSLRRKRYGSGESCASEVWLQNANDETDEFFDVNKAERAKTQLVKWLANPHWKNLDSISDCLHFTHFLGQSTRQLFVHQEGQERWNRMQGPAGVKTLWAIEQSLGRPGTTLAFNKKSGELKEKIIDIKDEKASTERLLERITKQRTIARAQAAISPSELTERILSIEALLREQFDNQDFDIKEDIDETLKRLKLILEQEGKKLQEREELLRSWQKLTLEYQGLRENEEQSIISLAIVEKQIEKKKEQLDLTVSAELIQREKLDAAKEISNKESKELEQLVKLISLNDDFSNKAAELEKIAQQFGFEEQLKVDIEKEVSALATELEVLKFKRQEYKALIQELDSLRNLHDSAVNLNEAKTNIEKVTLEARNASQDILHFTKVKGDQEKVKLGLLEKRHTLDIKKKEAEINADAMSSAIAQIAAALSDEDCNCPLCKTPFQVKGALKSLAYDSANAIDPKIAEIEVLNKSIDENIHEIDIDIASIEDKLQAAYKVVDNLELAKKNVVQLEQHIRMEPLLVNVPSDDFIKVIALKSSELNQNAEAVMADISSSKSLSELEKELNGKQHQFDGVTEKARKLSSLTNSYNAEIEALKVQLKHVLGSSTLFLKHQTSTEFGSLINESHIIEKNAQLEKCQKARDVIQDIELEVNKKNSECLEHRNELDTLVNDLSSRKKAIESMVNSRLLLSERWKKEIDNGDPSLNAVTEKLGQMPRLFESLKGAQVEFDLLRDGRKAYASQAMLEQLENDLADLIVKKKVESEEELLEQLNNEEKSLSIQSSKLDEVRKQRDEIVQRLKQRNKEIRSKVSDPLNASVAKFCAALMSDKNYKVSVESVAKAASAQSLLSFSSDGEPTEKNPLLYLSEGQLSAVSLCLQFGAAVTYPWSRWKALLLDDPLHHNDSIHSSAFIDVVRNLILDQGYQVIVSTHNMELAGYFLRKCSNAGISSRYWHVYGKDENGVLLEKGIS